MPPETTIQERLRPVLEPEYEVVRSLSSSETADVYLLREPALRRLVAIKVMSSRLAQDAKAVLRFQREVRAVARVSHPNVVTIFRVGELPDGPPFLIMQYVKGRSLEARMAAEGLLPVSDARRALCQIAAALAATHESGVVHRDVNAGNVLCEDRSGRCLLTDFGIAALITSGEANEGRITTAGHVVADFRTVSPEQLTGDPVAGYADVYSLAILGYALLTGRSPYDANTPAEFAHAHLNAEPVPIASLRPDVTEDLADLLARCLAKNPTHRPRAADVAHRLGGSRTSPGSAPTDSGDSPASGPDSSPEPATKTRPAGGVEAAFAPKDERRTGDRLRLQLIGGLELETADGRRVLSVLAQPKRIALLTYLAVGGTGGFKRRDRLIGLLWADLEAERARHALRQAVYVLRRALGPHVIVSRGDEELALDSERLWCDVTEFDRAVRESRDREAMNLYTGDLLPGFFVSGAPEFERWLEVERLSLARQASEAAWRLADESEADGKGQEAAAWARKAADCVPFDEVSVRRLLELLDRCRDRAAAIQLYESFQHRLEAEYEAEPATETKELIARVRGG